jgi:hypothetical protein
MRLLAIGKSFLVAFAGAGLVSFFLMMTIIPSMALMQRLRGDIAQKSVVVNPAGFMRTYGIGLAAAAFVIIFIVAMIRFRRAEQAALARH